LAWLRSCWYLLSNLSNSMLVAETASSVILCLFAGELGKVLMDTDTRKALEVQDILYRAGLRLPHVTVLDRRLGIHRFF
jgi:hypothetical protein